MNFEKIDSHNIMLSKPATVLQVSPDKKKESLLPLLHNGHKYYEFNMRTKICDEVKLTGRYRHFITGYEEYTYIKKPECIYIPAISEEKAFEKFVAMHKKHLGITFREEK